MNIVMMSNTYKPFVGGVEKSIEIYTHELRKQGHKVLIVAPEYEDYTNDDYGVFRIPAVQNFNGTDFPVPLPLTGALKRRLKEYRPDIVHAHHPFLIGDTAQRVAAQFSIPIVFTYHTAFEDYTHYVPGDSPALKKFVKQLAVGYANMCNTVIAPCRDVRDELKESGVRNTIRILPTGIYTDRFQTGDGEAFRRKFDIPGERKLLGFVSRLAPEKNSTFLAEAVAEYMVHTEDAHFAVAGKGESREVFEDIFTQRGIADRLHLTGVLEGTDLADAYHAFDVFVYASKTETQGLVIAEAMAAGVPVTALSARAVKNIIRDEYNGKLVYTEDIHAFAEAIDWYFSRSQEKKDMLKKGALDTAENYSIDTTCHTLLTIYESVITTETSAPTDEDMHGITTTKKRISRELKLLKNFLSATGEAMGKGV
jgi:glycosyltransferase involved in cell wall biosynthesis